MNLNFYYWYFESAIPSYFCDKLVEYGNAQRDEIARTADFNSPDSLSEEELQILYEKRNSNVTWISKQWLYNEIHPYVQLANQNAGWNFDWDWSEPVQFTKYKLNQFYDWHTDSSQQVYGSQHGPMLENKMRKLSTIVSLSDGNEFEGGELEFKYFDQGAGEEKVHQVTEYLKKGSVIVFPSFVWHRVKPVTSGNRYSLVMWNCGYPFR